MRSLITRFIPDESYEAFMFRSGLALYAAIILFGSIPGARAEMGEVASGLVLHFAAYSCIAFLLACGVSGGPSLKAFKAFFLVAAMGALDEGIQAFLPYRNGAIMDWSVDVAAGLFTALLYRAAAAGEPSVTT